MCLVSEHISSSIYIYQYPEVVKEGGQIVWPRIRFLAFTMAKIFCSLFAKALAILSIVHLVHGKTQLLGLVTQ